MSKSSPDIHWNERAALEPDAAAVNIADVSQRELETAFLLRHLRPADKVLEVGCGNGFLTEILRQSVAHVDAFDYAENMVAKAIELQGERNNRFFHDNLLAPRAWSGPYDAIVCVRVLINLRDLAEQKRGIDHMTQALRPGGRLLLIEGYKDGFGELNRVRETAGLDRLQPAAINFYSALGDVRAHLDPFYTIEAEFHTGCFDFLTRVVHPALVGADKAVGHGEFHRRILPVARAFNPDAFASLARLRGYSLIKRQA